MRTQFLKTAATWSTSTRAFQFTIDVISMACHCSASAAPRELLVALISLTSAAPGCTMDVPSPSSNVLLATVCRAANVTQSPLDQLEVALEAMCCMAAPFHSRYQVHSAMQRRVGGQGIVQFATIINTEDKVWLQLTRV